MTQKIQISSIGFLIVCGIMAGILGLTAPEDFPQNARFEVHEGETLLSISRRLKEEHIISSSLLFRGWVSTLGKDKDIGLGVYEFSNRVPLGGVIAKIVQGPDEPLVSVTIPEGFTSEEIARAFKKVLPQFREEAFLSRVREKKLDGYLFPSTYYPLPSFTENDVIKLLNETFEKEYGKRFANLSFPKHVPTRNDVISLAAILEGEAKSEEDMRIVSGILHKRLEMGMRLQVDVASSTYKEGGIPSIPINNPGSKAIEAVFNPEDNPYLYYLTGNDGRMYYAKTFEEHKRNINRYLR